MEMCAQTPSLDAASPLPLAFASVNIKEQDMVLTAGVDGELLLVDQNTPQYRIDPIGQEGQDGDREHQKN